LASKAIDPSLTPVFIDVGGAGPGVIPPTNGTGMSWPGLNQFSIMSGSFFIFSQPSLSNAGMNDSPPFRAGFFNLFRATNPFIKPA
jgi:hypothetical protein